MLLFNFCLQVYVKMHQIVFVRYLLGPERREKRGDIGKRVQTQLKGVSSEGLFSMVTTVNNTALYTWKLLRIDLKHSHQKKKKLTLWGVGCVNYHDLCNHCTMYIKSLHCTLQIYTVMFVHYSSVKLEQIQNKCKTSFCIIMYVYA